MRYKNGREAHNGDKVMWITSPTPVIGVLYDAKESSNAYKGKLAAITVHDPVPNLSECLRVDDAMLELNRTVSIQRESGHWRLVLDHDSQGWTVVRERNLLGPVGMTQTQWWNGTQWDSVKIHLPPNGPRSLNEAIDALNQTTKERTMTATFVRKLLEGWVGDALLYRLSEPVPCEQYATSGEDGHNFEDATCDHIIVSAVVAPFSGSEVMIFPANSDGEAMSMLDLYCRRGTLDHDAVLKEFLEVTMCESVD